MPHKNQPREQTPNPMSGYTQAHEVLENAPADSRLAASINKSNQSYLKRTSGFVYGGNYDSYYNHSAKDFQSDKITDLFTEDGKIVTRRDLDYKGQQASGLIQQGKRIQRERYLIHMLNEALKKQGLT